MTDISIPTPCNGQYDRYPVYRLLVMDNMTDISITIASNGQFDRFQIERLLVMASMTDIYTERKSELLESRLHSYEINFPTGIDALFTEYYNITADIEMKKLTAVMESSPQYHCRINQYYNHQRQLLMYRIDRKLNSLVNPPTCQSTLNTRNVMVLRDWFNQHRHHPYPTREQIKKMSKISTIKMQDVRVWFACERIRQSAAVIRKSANKF
ncbi:unnamed protein product [Mytilus edulis]|uniref:Homeobox domain-containing protein n=1 Tax=Mytilus edulis TaxID=6550 RepID=A0A8S3RSK5_MYTED|nr:unnamed protein product [Mytilus edulis]